MSQFSGYAARAAMVAAIGAVASMAGLSAAAASERVIVALNPPTAETNLFWSGIGERMPSMQALVGHDPVSGAYDNSELAREWSASEDFQEWTFHLYEDAEFHFGWGPVTAHDVVHSYELHTGPDSTIVGLSHLRASEVEAVDDHTVVFRFDEPRTDYPFHHAGRGSMVVYSKAQFEAEGLDGYVNRPAGTAGFQYVERRVGEGMVFERAPDQWQGIEPDFAELEIRWAAEPATKLAMLLAGEAHITDLPREIQADALAAGHVIIASTNPAMTTGGVFNGLYQRTGDEAHRPDLPWADIRVREAMNRALNREEMIEVLYEGRATAVPSWIMDARHEGYVPELAERFEAEYGYDPDRARELLAEAGYPDAFPDPVIPIISSALAGNPEFGTLAELLQVYFEEIGLQTEIREMDWASLGALGRGRQAYSIGPIRNAPIRPSEAGLVNYFTSRGTPYGGYESDTIEALADELERTIDPEERNRIASEAFVYLFEQYADMPLAAVHAEVVANPDVVAGWTFPGVTTNSVSHWHLIQKAHR
jgi:peptide/nickel transport system substrate-binding protein